MISMRVLVKMVYGGLDGWLSVYYLPYILSVSSVFSEIGRKVGGLLSVPDDIGQEGG